MKYNKIEGIDKDWSAITLGCWQLAPSEGWGDLCSPKDAEAVVKTALDSGITAFDTAEGYGDGESERRLGRALGSKKDDVIVISKIWPDAELTLEDYQNRLDGTLQALNRDFVDLYLIHWPGDYFNTSENSQKLVDFMQSFKDSGKAKTIGLSNFYKKNLDLLGDNLSRFVINQMEYSLLERKCEGETLKACKDHNVQYMAYSPTAKGLLARALKDEERQFPARQHDEFFHKELYPVAVKMFDSVQEVANEIGCKPIEVALAWVIAQDNVHTAIVGSRKPQQVPEFAKAGGVELSQEHLSRLTQASDRYYAERNKVLV